MKCLPNIVVQGKKDSSQNFEYTCLEACVMALSMTHYNPVQRDDKWFSQQFIY
jgi:hypothetical protein